MEAYKLWVRKNREFVHSLESLANAVTWLLPERFSNSEIGGEAVYSFLGVFSAINQHIIETAPSRLRPPGSGDSSFPWSLCVSSIKDLETLVEVVAQHIVGEDGKWNFIAATEALKVMVRLASFRDSGYKMLLQGGEIANVEKHSVDQGLRHCAPGHLQVYNGYMPPNLEARAMSALNRFGEKAKMTADPMWRRHLQQNPERQMLIEKPTLSSVWSQRGLYGQLFVTGEVLSILRPLVYVLLIRRYGIRSWKPWLLSLAMDFTGMGILSHATSSSPDCGEKLYQLSTSEKDEIRRRRLIWALYIMRDPFFTKYTKHRLEKADTYLSNVPFIGFLSGKLVELLIGAQTRYTYTSGS